MNLAATDVNVNTTLRTSERNNCGVYFVLFLLFIINSLSLEIDIKFNAKGKHEIKYRAGLVIIGLL